MKVDLDKTLEHYGITARRRIICPLHDERTPSCMVDLDEGVWYCFSCGAGGNGLTLIEMKEGLGKRDARTFATDNGLTTSDDSGGSGRVSRSTMGLVRSPRAPRGKRDRPGHGKYIPSWRRD